MRSSPRITSCGTPGPSFRMSKHDLRARPVFHHQREATWAHLTVVMASLAVARYIQEATGISIKRVIRTLKTPPGRHHQPQRTPPHRRRPPDPPSRRHPHRPQHPNRALRLFNSSLMPAPTRAASRKALLQGVTGCLRSLLGYWSTAMAMASRFSSGAGRRPCRVCRNPPSSSSLSKGSYHRKPVVIADSEPSMIRCFSLVISWPRLFAYLS